MKDLALIGVTSFSTKAVLGKRTTTAEKEDDEHEVNGARNIGSNSSDANSAHAHERVDDAGAGDVAQGTDGKDVPQEDGHDGAAARETARVHASYDNRPEDNGKDLDADVFSKLSPLTMRMWRMQATVVSIGGARPPSSAASP